MNALLFTIGTALSLTVLTACSPKNEPVQPTAEARSPSVSIANTGEVKVSKASLVQASDEFLLEALDSSDYPILEDIFKAMSGFKSSCPDASECEKYVVKSWDDALKATPVRENLDLPFRKSYLNSLQGQAPHIQQETTKKAFAVRYSQLKELVAAKSVCFLYSPWNLEFINDKYHLAGGNGIHTAVRTNLLSTANFNTPVFSGENIYIVSQDGKFFAPVPAQKFGEENYKKYAALSQKPAEIRPSLKFCGKPAGEYNNYMFELKKASTPAVKVDPLAPPPGPPAMVDPQPVTGLFRISKPIEWVQPPNMQKFDFIPMEWFVPAI